MVNVSFFFIYNQGYVEDVAARGAIGEHYQERRSIPYIKKDTQSSVFLKKRRWQCGAKERIKRAQCELAH